MAIKGGRVKFWSWEREIMSYTHLIRQTQTSHSHKCLPLSLNPIRTRTLLNIKCLIIKFVNGGKFFWCISILRFLQNISLKISNMIKESIFFARFKNALVRKWKNNFIEMFFFLEGCYDYAVPEAGTIPLLSQEQTLPLPRPHFNSNASDISRATTRSSKTEGKKVKQCATNFLLPQKKYPQTCEIFVKYVFDLIRF